MENIFSGVWPEWKAEKMIGRGSFGAVYSAVRNESGVQTRSAIKVVSIPSDDSGAGDMEGLTSSETTVYLQNMVNDFIGEIKVMESFKGMQNIVSIEDFKVVKKTDGVGWRIYIRMELLTPFNQYVSSHPLTEGDIIRLGTEICTALEYCQSRDLIHRDIKPENIFVNDFGCFKLGDFGIARKLESMTSGMSQKGTMSYMAPEVAHGVRYDQRVDICSLGLVLYRLLNNGCPPFMTDRTQLLSPEMRTKSREQRLGGVPLPEPANGSPALKAVVMRACAYDPADRFPDAAAMKSALQAVRGGKFGESVSTVSAEPTGTRTAHSPRNTDSASVTGSGPAKGDGKLPGNRASRVRGVLVSLLSAVVVAAVVLAVVLLNRPYPHRFGGMIAQGSEESTSSAEVSSPDETESQTATSAPETSAATTPETSSSTQPQEESSEADTSSDNPYPGGIGNQLSKLLEDVDYDDYLHYVMEDLDILRYYGDEYYEYVGQNCNSSVMVEEDWPEKGRNFTLKLSNYTTSTYPYGTSTDLTVLEYLTNTKHMTEFVAKYNQINDISQLVDNGYDNLTTLDLSYNKITDFSQLQELTQLKYLNVSNNPIKDIDGLEFLKNLEYLDLSGIEIHSYDDLQPYLTELPNLNTLIVEKLHMSEEDQERLRQDFEGKGVSIRM